MKIRIVKNNRIDKYLVETLNACVTYNKGSLNVDRITYFDDPNEYWFPVTYTDDGLIVTFTTKEYVRAEYLAQIIMNYVKGTEVIMEYEV